MMKGIQSLSNEDTLKKVVDQVNFRIKEYNSTIASIEATITALAAVVATLRTDLTTLQASVDTIPRVEDIITYKTSGGSYSIVFDETGKIVYGKR